MSDSAFKTAAYPGYTTAQLRAFIADPDGGSQENNKAIADAMTAEVLRRDRVAAGDVSVMTNGERLRHVKSEG